MTERLDNEIKSLIRKSYLTIEELKKDMRIPHKSRFLIGDVQSNLMSLWLRAVKKQTWGAVSGAEIMESGNK